MKETKCYNIIIESISNYYNTEDYIDYVFDRDITTKYKKKKQGLRLVEFEEEEKLEPLEEIEELEEEIIIKPKKKVLKKKLPKKLIIEEELKDEGVKDEEIIEEIIEEIKEKEKEEEVKEEEFLIKKKPKNKTKKIEKVVNPLGKTGVKKTKKLLVI